MKENTHVNIILDVVTLKNIDALQKISIETFSDTFGTENSNEDLEKYLHSTYNKQRLIKENNDPHTNFQLISYKHELAGYIKLNENSAQTELKDDNALEVERIYILNTFQRLGLGHYLINYAINQAKIKQKDYIWLGVWEYNLDAIHFYEKQGFKSFSEHTFYLGDDKQRDILMKKELRI